VNEERMQILNMIEKGQISAEEGVRLLETLADTEASTGETASSRADTGAAPGAAPDFGDPDRFWVYPAAVGGGIAFIGAAIYLAIYSRAGMTFWLTCGIIPFLLGLTVVMLAWWSREARWFHLRITNMRTDRREFAMSLPLPLSLAAWGVGIARHFSPRFRETGVDEMIQALRDGLEEGGQPLVVDVTNDEEGERIQVYLG
jgi:hypothetical protein